jgi:hypothetical protein
MKYYTERVYRVGSLLKRHIIEIKCRSVRSEYTIHNGGWPAKPA